MQQKANIPTLIIAITMMAKWKLPKSEQNDPHISQNLFKIKSHLTYTYERKFMTMFWSVLDHCRHNREDISGGGKEMVVSST